MAFTIKKIEKLKFKKNMFELYFENEKKIIVFVDTIVKFALKPGINISEKEHSALLSYDNSSRVMSTALNLISKKDYTEASLKEKFFQKGYNTDIAEKAIIRLKELNYLNDSKYAKNYAMYLHRNGKGPFLIKDELKRKGINRKLIKETLNYILEESDSYENILKILKTKFKNFNNKDQKETRRVISFFLRRGFSFEDISKAIRGSTNKN